MICTRRPAPLLLLAALALSACGAPTPAPTPELLRPTATATLPTGPVVASPVPSPTFVRPGDPVTLTLWLTEALSPTISTPGGAELAVQFATFEQTHPNVTLQIVRKKASGPGGMLDFLTSASEVAPSILPDLLVLDAGELPAAARAGLVAPLDGVIGPDVTGNLYPFAQALATVDKQLYGVPFAADVQHLAYNRTSLAKPPLTWTDVLTSGARLGFAAGNPNAMEATLADYLAAGGTLVDAAGQPHLDVEPLSRVLLYYRSGQDTGLIADSVAQTETPAGVWEQYRGGELAMVLVNASLYLTEREALRATEVAVPPGPDRPESGVAHAWTWAMTPRSDPTRRQLSGELVTWLLEPRNLGAWTLAADLLPTRRGAMARWPAEDPYAAFLGAYLENVIPEPEAAVRVKVMPALYHAVQAVLVNGVSPEVAAAAAAAEVRP